MNKTILMGRLVADPELRFIQSGTAVCNFTMAVDRGLSKEKKTEYQAKNLPTADFPRVIAWGKTAELCAQYLAKGRRVLVEGTLQTSTYKDNGNTRYSTDIKADKVEFIDFGDKQQSDQPQANYNTDDFQAIEDDEDIPF